jgi:sulfite exporter TauE/SafE
MDLTLALTAFLMGLAGAPHCAAMCGPSCAAVLGGSEFRPGSPSGVASVSLSFHAARVASYALAGALAAAGVGLLAWAGQAAPWVKPLWMLLHLAALVLGLWLALTGRQPAFMSKIGKARHNPRAPRRVHVVSGTSAALPLSRGLTPGSLAAVSAGSLWVIWPCGLLQSALVVSGLANTPLSGAFAMAAFALASSMGLMWLPQLWRWWVQRSGSTAARVRFERWLVRLAGGLLVLGSVWALGQDVWGRVWAYCFG